MTRQNGDLSFEILLDFIDFLHISSSDIGDQLNFVAKKIILSLEPIHLSVYQKDSGNEIREIGRWGAELELDFSKNQYLTMHISKSLLNESSKSHAPASNLFSDSSLIHGLSDLVSMFSAPIYASGCLIAITKLDPKKHDEFLIKSIASLVSLKLRLANAQLKEDHHSEKRQDKSNSLELSKRQKLVLDGILKGYTNRVISEEIGYSESLVRQETIVIFRHFGVTGRAELIKQIDI